MCIVCWLLVFLVLIEVFSSCSLTLSNVANFFFKIWKRSCPVVRNSLIYSVIEAMEVNWWKVVCHSVEQIHNKKCYQYTSWLMFYKQLKFLIVWFQLCPTPPKNVHVFTDNIVRKVSSGQICPRFLRTCLSSNIVEVLTIQKADPFPYFSTEH